MEGGEEEGAAGCRRYKVKRWGYLGGEVKGVRGGEGA